MSRIRSKNTKPEKIVRSLLHRMGYRFRLHVKNLPGKPDIVLLKYKTIIFVHGCFWHQHPMVGCKKSRIPKSAQNYWIPKLQKTIARDKLHKKLLKKLGWEVKVIWECQINENKIEKLLQQLRDKHRLTADIQQVLKYNS